VRDIFPEWYAPDQDELKAILTNGTIALDANVLLDLYRVGIDERTQIMDVFGSQNVRERLWLPYQAALEYQRNRVTVAKGHNAIYDDIVSSIDKTKQDISKSIDTLRDKTIKVALKEKLSSIIDPPIESLRKEVLSLREQNALTLGHTNSPDLLRIEIDKIFGDKGQVGPRPDSAILAERMSHVEERYDNCIPPGYDDAKKKANREGDLLIWFEILHRAKTTSTPILFISSDTKESWYHRENGVTVGPRRELLIEIAKVTQERYHQLPLDRFLQLANEFLSAKVQPATIATLNALNTISDEERARRVNFILHHFREEFANDDAYKLITETAKRGTLSNFERKTLMRALDLVDNPSSDVETAEETVSIMRKLRARKLNTERERERARVNDFLFDDSNSEDDD